METVAWIKACRPKTLIAGLSPVAIATVLGFYSFSLGVFFSLLGTALGIQICTNLANDLFDFLKGADTKHRKGPPRMTATGTISLSEMKKGVVIAFVLTALLGLTLVMQGGLVVAAIFALSLFLAYAYTAGPFPLSYLGIADLFVILFFGPIAVGGGYYLYTHTLSWEAALMGLSPGALSTAIYSLNNLRDEEEDRLSGKKTLVVRFGKAFGRAEYILSLVIAFAAPLYVGRGLLAELALIPAVPLVRALFAKNPDYNKLLAKTAGLLALFTLLFCF